MLQLWLNDFLKELEKEQEAPSLHSDNQSAVDLENNPIYHDRIKHIDVLYYFLCKMLKDSVFLLLKIRTSQNPTDMLTKMVVVEKLKSCSASAGLQGRGSEFESLEVTISREQEEKGRKMDAAAVSTQSPSRRLLKCWSLIADLNR